MVVKVDGSWDNAKRALEQCVMKVGGRKVVVRGDVYWEFMAADTLERRRWGNRRSLGRVCEGREWEEPLAGAVGKRLEDEGKDAEGGGEESSDEI